jgi:hypothetical protein
MLLLFLLLDLPVQILLLSPVLLWLVADPRWHPWIIALGVFAWGGLGLIVWRRFARAEAEERSAKRPQGDWRWPASMPADLYDQHLRLLLHNHGWRDLQTLALEQAAVTLVLQKDRLRLVVRARRAPLVSPGPEIDALASLRDAHRADAACLVLAGRVGASLAAAASLRGVHVLRLSDVRFLDSPSGPLAVALRRR